MRSASVPFLCVLGLTTLSNSRRTPQDLTSIFQRQETCGSDITKECTTSTQDCVNAICSTCQDIPGIAQCCALTTNDLILECLENALQGATQSSIPSTSNTITSLSPTIASSEANSPDYTACVSFEAAFLACEDATSGFTSEPFATKASCLCYSSSTWVPSVFDGEWSSCLGFYSTSSPAYYTSLVNETDFVGFAPCSSVGDVAILTPASVSATTTSSLVSSSGSESFVGQTITSTSNQATTSTVLASPSASESASNGASDIRSLRDFIFLGFGLYMSLLTSCCW